MHYPPITSKIYKNENRDFIDIMKKYNVKICLYGHLHGEAINEAIEGEFDNIKFTLVSADGLDFKIYDLNL